MIDDVLIDGIVEIGNSPKLIKMVEPQVAFPMKIEAWMVKRIFKVVDLIQEAYELRGTNAEGVGTLQSEEQGLHKRGQSVRKLQKSVVHPVPVSKVKSS